MADTVGTRLLSQGATDVMYTDRRNFYLRPGYLAELWPDAAPFTTFLSQLMTIENAPDPDYKIFESRNYWVDNFQAQQAEAGTDVLTTGTQITGHMIDDGSGAGSTKVSTVGMMVEIWDSALSAKKAVAVINSVTTGATYDTVSFTPIWVAVSGTTAVADNDYWFAIADAQAEGSGAPEAVSDELTVKWNTCQIVETPVEMSDVARKANLRPVNEWEREVMEASKAHKVKIERLMLLGVRKGATATDMLSAPSHISDSNGLIRTTAGFIPIMNEQHATPTEDRLQNITVSSYTWDDFVDDMTAIGYYQDGTTPLYVFAGSTVTGAFDKWAATGFGKSNVRVDMTPPTQSDFGFKMRSIFTSAAEIRLVNTPVLRGRYAGYAPIIDPRYVGIVKYEADQYKTNIQDNDAKRRKDEYFSDIGFYMPMLEKHAMIVAS